MFILEGMLDASFIAWTSGFLALSLLFLIYRYGTQNHDYWKKRGVPYVKPLPFIGSTELFTNKKLEDIEEERYYKYGKVYGFFEGNTPKLSIADPELLKCILVKDFQYFTNRIVFNTGDPVFDKMLSLLEGEDWKRVRAIISPTFSTSKMKRVMGIFQDCAKTLLQNFQKSATKGEDVDVAKYYGAFTMDVIASAAFSTKIDCLNDPENKFVKTAKDAFEEIPVIKLLFFILMPRICKLLHLKIFRSENMEFFKKVTIEIIEERKRTGQTRNDFLQLLMDASAEALEEETLEDKFQDIASNYDEETVHHPDLKNLQNKTLTMNELVAQCIIFFLAGYHTTATALAIATYELALNPDVQEKLYDEIKEVLTETNGELTYEGVHKMKYLDNIISESLRIYLPATRLDRTADMDYKLGDTGIVISKGTVVTVPTFTMHRDPNLFPDPEKFDPDRFSSEEKAKHIPYSYLPFGAGPRKCVGMRFALIELKVCLIHIFSVFRVEKCSKTSIPPEFGRASNVLQPKEIFLKMEVRKESILKL